MGQNKALNSNALMAISYGRQRWWLFIASHIID
jgi:hypothetical protein